MEQIFLRLEQILRQRVIGDTERELLYVIMEMYMYMRLATSRFPKDYLMRLLKNTEKVDIIKA